MKRNYLNPAPPESNKAKHKFSANRGQGTMSLAGAGQSPQIIAARQFPSTGVYEPHLSKPPGLLPTAVRRSFAFVQYSFLCVISPFVAYLPPCPVLFFLSGIPRCRKRRGENANPRTNFIFCKKQRIFWHVCAGQGRDNGSNAAKERRKTFGRGTGMERCEPEPKPAKSIYKAKMKDAHHKTVKFIQKIENRAPGIPGARAIV